MAKCSVTTTVAINKHNSVCTLCISVCPSLYCLIFPDLWQYFPNLFVNILIPQKVSWHQTKFVGCKYIVLIRSRSVQPQLWCTDFLAQFFLHEFFIFILIKKFEFIDKKFKNILFLKWHYYITLVDELINKRVRLFWMLFFSDVTFTHY